MRRGQALVLAVIALVAAAVGAREVLSDGSPRGTVAGRVSTGALCSSSTPRARTACARWLQGNPTLELSPVGRFGSRNFAVVPDPRGRFRLDLAPGSYLAWWSSSTRGGSVTNRMNHVWRVRAGRTTAVGTLTPYIRQELDAG